MQDDLPIPVHQRHRVRELLRQIDEGKRVFDVRDLVDEPGLLDFDKPMSKAAGAKIDGIAELLQLARDAGLIRGYRERRNKRSWIYEYRAVGASGLTTVGREFLADSPKAQKERGADREAHRRKDRLLAEAWASGEYESRKALAIQFRMTEKEVLRALDRVRKRGGRE